ncbi:TnsD family Tn7-like transposition protein [Cupriavidus necator]
MITAFFPPILPEEPIGYYINRIEGHCGIGNRRPVRAEQLGAPGRRVDMRLPRNLNQLMRTLSLAFPDMCVWDWLSLHSDFPYYAETLSKTGRESLLAHMCSYKSGPLLPLHALPGEDSFLARLLWCSECKAEDEKEFGCGYVHRYSTLPCVGFCPLHETRLLPENLAATIAPQTSGSAFKNTLEFCRASCRLLGQTTTGGCHHLTEVQGRLEMAGLLTKAGRVRVQRLVEGICSSYEDGFLQPTLAALTHDAEAVEAWLKLALRQSCHPVYYLLLMGGIRGTWTLLVQSASLHIYEDRCARAIEEVKRGASVRSASAAAGVATATLLRRIRPVGIPYRTRAKCLFSSVQRQVLQSLASGASVAVVCKRYSISPSSAYRILASSAQVQHARRCESLAKSRNSCRSAWRSLLEENPNATRTALRQRESAAWTWLSRHDSAWLKENQPPSMRGGASRAKTFPSSAEVAEAHARLKSVEVRISSARPLTAQRVLDAAGIPSSANARLLRCESYRAELTRLVRTHNI